MKVKTLVLVVLFCLVLSLVYSAPPKKRTKKSKHQDKPKDLFERGLVKKRDFPLNKLLENYDKNLPRTYNPKRYSSPSLAFVTPWNSKGYDVAKTFNYKFTYVSPVWLQIVPSENRDSIIMRGKHDIDQDWIKEVRNVKGNEESPLIVPRILFEEWSEQAYASFGDQKIKDYIADMILKEAMESGFDGFVLDFSYRTYSEHDGSLIKLIKAIGTLLHKNDKKLLVVVAPYFTQVDLFTNEDYEQLYQFVDEFIVMTYDYSSQRGRTGPSSPVSWITETVLKIIPPSKRGSDRETKLLLGLNFYGTVFSQKNSQPIFGDDFLSLIKQVRPDTIKWNNVFKEHHFIFQKEEQSFLVNFPTLAYIDERMELAESLGCGISIWEIGQGLDYFYDLF